MPKFVIARGDGTSSGKFGNGEVGTFEREEPREEIAEADAAIAMQVLMWLAKDIAERPQHVKAVTAEFVERVRRLTWGVAGDMHGVLSPEDD
jgi:hypothetical protein